jgi:hypothetical protein
LAVRPPPPDDPALDPPADEPPPLDEVPREEPPSPLKAGDALPPLPPLRV